MLSCNISLTHIAVVYVTYRFVVFNTSAVLRLECSLDSLSIDSAHVIYVSEGYAVAV